MPRMRWTPATQPDESSSHSAGRYRNDTHDHRAAHLPRVLVRLLPEALLGAVSAEDRAWRPGRPATHGAHRFREGRVPRLLFDDPDVPPRLRRRDPGAKHFG